jgi:hypothetical protein
VQANHLRLAAQELFQGPKLRFATDERNAAPLGDRRSDYRSIIARAPRCNGGLRRARRCDPQPAAHLLLVANVLSKGSSDSLGARIQAEEPDDKPYLI